MIIITYSRHKSLKLLSNKKYLSCILNRLIHHKPSLVHKHAKLLQTSFANTKYTLLSRHTCLNNTIWKRYSSSSSNDDKNKDEEEEKDRKTKQMFMIQTGVAFAIAFLWFATKDGKSIDQNSVSWEYFVSDILPSGEVKKIVIDPQSSHSMYVFLHQGAIIDGRRVGMLKVDNIPDASRVTQMIRQEESKMRIDPVERITIKEERVISGILVVAAAILAMIGAVFVFRRLSSSMKGMMSSVQGMEQMLGSNHAALTKKTRVKFTDVAGMEEAKQEVMEFVHFLKNPEKYERLGGKMPKGCLLTGPPGVGKTLLAKAVATESDVPFFSKSGSDFVEMVGGLGAKRVRDLFKEARSQSPCIVYIDEVDAIGGKRNEKVGRGSGEYAQTLNQILVEMDGMLSGGHQVIVMASTNRPDILDPALLRPGRFDRHIYIDLPTLIERRQIFNNHLNNLKLKEKAEDYSDKLARLTPGMSGADIANVCNEAAIYAAREKDTSVDEKHFQHAIERILAGSKKKFSPLPPEDKMIVSMHESGHAIVGWMLEHTDVLMKVSIIPHTKSALGYSQMETLDRKLLYEQQLFERMCVALGGRAAESLYFDRITSGAEDDIKKVTKMAQAYVKQFGFSSKIGNLSYKEDQNTYVKPYSNSLQALMDEESRKLVYKAYNKAKEVLEQHKDKLLLLSKNLSDREVLQYDEIEGLIGPPVYGNKRKISEVTFGPFTSNLDEEK